MNDREYSAAYARAEQRKRDEINRAARAAAAQAAAEIMGGRGVVMGGPGYGFHAKPSESYRELTSRISMYIRHGVWLDEGDEDESYGP
jgi:hypothetical protein